MNPVWSFRNELAVRMLLLRVSWSCTSATSKTLSQCCECGTLTRRLRRIDCTSALPLQSAALGCAGGLLAGVMFYLFEALGYGLCCTLERHGLMRRFCPDAKRLTDHSLTNIVSVGAFYCPVYWLVVRDWRSLAATASSNFAFLRVFAFVWMGLVLHDAWFFFMHSALHRFKSVYLAVHARHHELGSNVTAYGTAFGEAADYGLCICLFHLLVYVYLRSSTTWNPVALAAFFFAEVSTDISGHCGYEVPDWLNAIITIGVGTVTPGFASSKSHYIHHLDPRYNRSLYFTWWDRLACTYKDTHPCLGEAPDDTPHEE